MNHWWGSPHAKQIGRDFTKMVIDILAIVNGLGIELDSSIGGIFRNASKQNETRTTFC